MKTCSCGSMIKGFDKIRGVCCSECISKDTDERQKTTIRKETNDLYVLAEAAKEQGKTEFKYGNMLYYKLTKKGFYNYHTFKGEEIIDKKYKWRVKDE